MSEHSPEGDRYCWEGIRVGSLVPSPRSSRTALEIRVQAGGALLDRLPIEAFVRGGSVSAPHAVRQLGRAYEVLLVPEDCPEQVRQGLCRLATIPALRELPAPQQPAPKESMAGAAACARSERLVSV